MSKEIYMEDVSSIALAAMKTIEEGLKEFGLAVPENLEDEIFVPMVNTLEKVANYPDYRSQN
jgi:nitrogen-specific signal transduction histidine kinase